jgi:hypothetical protein
MDADNASEHGLKSGDIIAGKYRVEREIGRGGMGIVVSATHVDLDQRVAIKVLQKSSAFDRDALLRFLREARSAAKIRSEHVARVMDVGKLEDGLMYIVMEYLDGTDLAGVLRKEGPLRVTVSRRGLHSPSMRRHCSGACGWDHSSRYQAGEFVFGSTTWTSEYDQNTRFRRFESCQKRIAGQRHIGLANGSSLRVANVHVAGAA